MLKPQSHLQDFTFKCKEEESVFAMTAEDLYKANHRDAGEFFEEGERSAVSAGGFKGAQTIPLSHL